MTVHFGLWLRKKGRPCSNFQIFTCYFSSVSPRSRSPGPARHDHPEFEKDAEDRWWRNYGPRVVQNAGQTLYESLRPEVEDDVANVVESLIL